MKTNDLCRRTSKCMHDMNQTEAEYLRHSKRSQTASLSQIGPVVLEISPDIVHVQNRSRDLRIDHDSDFFAFGAHAQLPPLHS